MDYRYSEINRLETAIQRNEYSIKNDLLSKHEFDITDEGDNQLFDLYGVQGEVEWFLKNVVLAWQRDRVAQFEKELQEEMIRRRQDEIKRQSPLSSVEGVEGIPGEDNRG